MWYCSGIGPNYVNCNAAFSDRSTKGLQGSHYTLRFYCKPGNKEPVSCCSKTAPLPSVFEKKKNALFPFFVVRRDLCQKSNECLIRLPAGTHAQSKLCCDTVNSAFAVVLSRFDVLPTVMLRDTFAVSKSNFCMYTLVLMVTAVL